MTDLLDKLMQAKKGNCKDHASTISTSCGATTERLGGIPQYRCDLKPHTDRVRHHVCGDGWKIEWGTGL